MLRVRRRISKNPQSKTRPHFPPDLLAGGKSAEFALIIWILLEENGALILQADDITISY
jgi:hypothetical protein